MKTQLVYLDAQDDSASALERLRWSQADRFVLIWPSHGRPLRHRLDFVLLSREAARRASQLGIVSHDPDVRHAAVGLNIAIFDDIESVSRQPWPPRLAARDLSTERERRPDLPARPLRPGAASSRVWGDAQRAGSMLVVILALLALSVVLGPAAVVELTPVERAENLTLPVTLTDDGAAANPGILLPARYLTVEVQAQTERPTAGTVLAPTTAATGEAVFTNRSGPPIALPLGTGLRTLDPTGPRFETAEAAVVPEGIGAEARVPIRASAAGEAGNVPAQAIGAIEGTLGLDLTVTNPEPTRGGESAARPGVTQADRNQAETTLRRQLLQSANARLQEMLGPGESLAPDSIVLSDLLTSSFEPAVGEPSEVIEGAMSARVEATVIDERRLRLAAEAAMADAVAPGRTLLPDSTRVDLETVGSGSNLSYRALIRARSRSDVDSGYVARTIAGKHVSEAASLLSARLSLAAPPRIRLWPSWWTRLPFLPLRIQPVWISPAS